MNRRDLVERIGVATGLGVAGVALAGCLGSIDANGGGDDGESGVGDGESGAGDDDSGADESGADDGGERGVDGDDGTAVDSVSEEELYERYELGDVDTVDSRGTVVVLNDDDRDRDVDLLVEPASVDDALERTLELPAGQAVEVLVADAGGFDAGIETAGSAATSSIGRTGGGRAAVRFVLTDHGVRTDTVSSSASR